MNRYYEFGYKIFGPFLYGFVMWLKKELQKKGFDKVFFFSRDGYMMKKAFDAVNDTGIRSEYVYVSRRSLRIPLLHRCRSFRESLRYLSWERYVSFGKLLEYYGFDAQECAELAEKYGVRLSDEIAFDRISSNAASKRIYTENYETINTRSCEQDAFLLKYLEQIGMNGKCAIADIGWHGNMQYYLELFSEAHDLGVRTDGFYIGICPDVPLRGSVSGYMYSPHDQRQRKKLLCFLGGYEKFLQSMEGSTASYKLSDSGRIVPELTEYEYAEDKHIMQAIRSWQKGAVDFIKKAAADGLRPDKKLAEPLIQFGMKPTLGDTKMFSFFYITDGTKVYFTAQKPLFCYKPREFLYAFSNSPWKTGFMKSAFRLPLPYYQIYRLIRK